MLTIRNRDELRRDAALRPLLERAVRAFAGEECAGFTCRPAERAIPARWVVLRNGAGSGLALWAEERLPCATGLRRAIVRVRCAAAIAAAFGGCGAFPMALSAECEPPKEWPRYRLALGDDECFVACSPDLPQAGLWTIAAVQESPRVRVALWCELPLPEGADLFLDRVQAKIEGSNAQGWLRCSERGAMTIEIAEEPEEAGSSHVKVRVELGLIELALEELLSLRPGSVLEIGAVGPLACTLSVGATELVRGVLEPSEGGFLLRVAPKR